MASDPQEMVGRARALGSAEIEARSRRAGFRSVESIVARLLDQCERHMERDRGNGNAMTAFSVEKRCWNGPGDCRRS